MITIDQKLITHMYKKTLAIGLFALLSLGASAQTSLRHGAWRAALLRNDGNKIIFNLDIQQQKGKTVFYIVNEPEKMLADEVTIVKDSVFINMPVFESAFRLKIISKDSLSGTWIRKTTSKDIVMPFTATTQEAYRFPAVHGDATESVAGKWKIDFTRSNNSEREAIGQFVQNGNQVTGSILTPSGDYRYLSGIVTGDSLQISTFDGIHAMVFTGKINKGNITNGNLYSGPVSKEVWTAKKDDQAALSTEQVTRLKDGEDGHLNFSFPDIDGKQVSIQDKRFKNKVVIIQLMGSWCPNCMDETAFLSEYYDKNNKKGVEVIGLAYEYTTDFKRSAASVRKFQKRFKVKYPLLITPATVSDSLHTEKTLPQLTAIKVFPTTLILDKSGKVTEITTDFYGPGTGDYYTRYKAAFEKKINALLEK
ncbi:peroxiredoxin family protein [Pedobacter cryoconitis]|nr:TlpA disulfide reductase family protein [Pedobacter cryoconitis]